MRGLPLDNRKLVVFTDSRQDAAKLSAGIELDHHRDLVRQSMLQGTGKLGGDKTAFQKLHNEGPSSLSDDEKVAVRRFCAQNPTIAAAFNNVRDGLDDDRDRAMVRQVEMSGEGPYGLTEISTVVWSDLLKLGINPAGPHPSLSARVGGKWERPDRLDTIATLLGSIPPQRGAKDLLGES